MVPYNLLFFFLLLIRHPRWHPPQDKFIIGPCGELEKKYSYLKPLNHLIDKLAAIFLVWPDRPYKMWAIFFFFFCVC